ncbi:MAG TPA: GNAT family N-acetyltransferase [Verrucomicrobiae bacterium]|nr:GNAT family N-acetyltransferase [Verrucomicrobiae bacterium]
MPLVGPRVVLRQWVDTDLANFTEMNADDRVMEFFPRKLTPEESRAFFAGSRNAIAKRGWDFWAVEIGGEFAGFTGLANPRFESHFTPCTEIGWRFRSEFWGKGYATEAARLALLYAFSTLRLEEVVSFTAEANVRSARVMQRLKMTHDPKDDFDHPRLPNGHRLQRHVLYRLKNARETTARLERELGSLGSEQADQFG